MPNLGTKQNTGSSDPFRPDVLGGKPEMDSVVKGILAAPGLLPECLRRFAWSEPEAFRDMVQETILHRAEILCSVKDGTFGQHYVSRLFPPTGKESERKKL